MSGEALQSGKGHRDENFPVASVLIAPRYRAPVMALRKQRDQWGLFDAFREEWESIYRTAKREPLVKVATAP